jgi:hypothetical protein
MKSEDKQLAEQVLNHLCQNGQVSGIRFGPILQLLISIEDSKKNLRGQIYLNLASKWTVFESLPARLPQSENDFAETTVEEDLHHLCKLREAEISKVDLENNSPHLLIHFIDGRILFVNGHSNGYESWDLGLGFRRAKETWLVVATPNDDVTVFAPEEFAAHPSPRSVVHQENGVKMITIKAINSTSTIIERLDS